MPLWLWLVDSLAIIVAVVVAAVIWLVLRRRILGSGGSFDLSTSREDGAGSWMLGFAVYRGEQLYWYRTFSASLRPRYRFDRGWMLIEGRRVPEGREAFAVHRGHVIVTSENRSGVRQMAMSPGALTGLLSWLESSPPGAQVNNVV